MRNADLVIVFNNGEVSFLIEGTSYATREEAISLAITKWRQSNSDTEAIADKPEELFFELKSIAIYEVRL